VGRERSAVVEHKRREVEVFDLPALVLDPGLLEQQPDLVARDLVVVEQHGIVFVYFTADRLNDRIAITVSPAAHATTTARLSHASAVTFVIPQISCRPFPAWSMNP
jgi:hypothetical protein